MPKSKKILIIGAGSAGKLVLKEVKKNPKLRLKPAGFIDDDLRKQGQKIDGLEVLGTRNDLEEVIKKKNIDEVFIALPSVHGKIIADIIQRLTKVKAKYKIVPRVREIIEEKVSINRIREVKPEDLLGRPVIRVDIKEVFNFLKGKRVLITGAAGSIGSELARQIAAYKPNKIIFFDWWENGMYELGLEFKDSYPRLTTIPVIGNIQDRQRVRGTIRNYKPQIIFHAAAYKHVPLMEENLTEAVKNNILGTKIMAEEAKKAKTSNFVLISTDKAVNPKSVMGTTKLIAETLISQLGKSGDTKFIAVRFGNVLESDGSVIPLFKKQIANGGPLTVTHPKMTRYFMTIPEAVQLVLKATAMGTGGETFILDMGEPVRILDLARNLIRLSGLIPGKDIKIKFTSKRPGEKLKEQLLTKKEQLMATKKERIYEIPNLMIDPKKFNQSVKKLETYAGLGKNKAILEEFRKLIPHFSGK